MVAGRFTILLQENVASSYSVNHQSRLSVLSSAAQAKVSTGECTPTVDHSDTKARPMYVGSECWLSRLVYKYCKLHFILSPILITKCLLGPSAKKGGVCEQAVPAK